MGTQADALNPGLATSLADQLLGLPVALPRALISAQSEDALLAIGRELPPALTVGFERALGTGSSGVDLFLAPGRTSAEDLPDIVAGRTFKAHAGDAADGFSEVWLEFDLTRGSRVPSVFASPAGEPPRRTAARLRSALGLQPPTQAQVTCLERLERLPRPAQVFQIGVMRSRNTDALRICIKGCLRERLLEVLSTCGWPGRGIDHATDDTTPTDGTQGSGAALAAVLQGPAEGFDPLRVGVELLPDGSIGESFGLELAPRRIYHDHLVRRWVGPLARLVKAGLCSAEERQALLDFHGHARASDAVPVWPFYHDLLPYAILEREPQVRWGLHHLKLVIHNGTAAAVKAYFGFGLGWEPAPR